MFKPQSKTKIKSLNKKLADGISSDLDLVFLLQDVEDPYNIGSIFRTADGCGASVILCGKTLIPDKSSEISRNSMGMERKVDWIYTNDFEETISKLKSKGYKIIGVELTENALMYDEYNYSNKTVLVLGNEAIGIYKKNLNTLDNVVFIPMLGKGPSLNVAIAAAVIGYEVLSKNK